MRTLEVSELGLVAGGMPVCTAENPGRNNLGGIVDTSRAGQDFINLYEAAVAAMSHVIERVAQSF